MKRTTLHHYIGMMTIGTLLITGASTAMAKKGGGQRGNQTPPANSNNNSGMTPAAPQTSKSDEFAKAQSDLDAAALAVRKGFEGSPDWTAAQQAVIAAHDGYADATKPVLDNLQTDPKYVAALADSTKAEDAVKSARAGETSGDVSDLAQKSMAAHSVVLSMESAALQADPTVVAAKKKQTDALAAVAKLREQEAAAVKADPDWQAAKARLAALNAPAGSTSGTSSAGATTPQN